MLYSKSVGVHMSKIYFNELKKIKFYQGIMFLTSCRKLSASNFSKDTNCRD